jgi:tetratricopeptide (TPR) repeat protein
MLRFAGNSARRASVPGCAVRPRCGPCWGKTVIRVGARNGRTGRAIVRAAFGVAMVLVLGAMPQTLLADPGDALDTGGGGAPARYIIHAAHALNEGRSTEALEYSDRAIAIYPDYIHAHFSRAIVLMDRGENDPAITEFDIVIEAHPEFPMVYIFRGEAYLRARRTSEAIADFNRALQARVGIGPYQYANALAMRSLAAELRGDVDPAMKDLDQAMRSVNGDFFNDYRMRNNRCYEAAVAGLLDSAQESCDASIQLHERNESVYDSRGLVDLKSGHWDAAVADYTKALYYRPEYTLALYGRGLAKRAMGDTAGAAADMQTAEKNEPAIAAIMTRLGASSSPATKPK